jgi:hypothetical protein
MTHSGGMPHTNIGDRGQRYEVRATGYPKKGEETVIGWAETEMGAHQMAAGIRKHPRCTGTRIIDRASDAAGH